MNDGRQFEKEFALFMEEDLGWNRTKTREFRNGLLSELSYEIDIHATKGGESFERLRKLGIFSILITFAGFFFYQTPEVQNLVLRFGINPADLAAFAIGFSVTGFIVGLYGKRNREKHAWVECKDTKSRIVRKHINKLKNSVDDVRNVSPSDSKWYPNDIFFASRSGYNSDAIKLAEEYGITLYQKKGNTFEKIS